MSVSAEHGSLISFLIVVSAIGITGNICVVLFYVKTKERLVSKIYISLSLIYGLISTTAVGQVASLLVATGTSTRAYNAVLFPRNTTSSNSSLPSTTSSLEGNSSSISPGSEVAAPLDTYVMVVHVVVLILLKRLAAFGNATMCFLRALTILYPFQKIGTKMVVLTFFIYMSAMLVLQMFGLLSSNTGFIEVNYLVLAPTDLNFFIVFTVAPFSLAVAVSIICILVSSVKLNLCHRAASIEKGKISRNHGRNKEMTITMLLAGMTFVTCNSISLFFLGYVATPTGRGTGEKGDFNLRMALTRNHGIIILGYLMDSGLLFVEAAITPIILNLRGKKLREESRRRLFYMLKRMSRSPGAEHRVGGVGEADLQTSMRTNFMMSTARTSMADVGGTSMREPTTTKLTREQSRESKWGSSEWDLGLVVRDEPVSITTEDIEMSILTTSAIVHSRHT